MKIIQLNIWQGKLGRQLIDFLKSEQPDFVCMQEVNDLEGRAGYKFFSTLNEIKDGGGFSDAFMSATYSSRYMERELDYGNAMLSRLPFASTKTVFTRGEYSKRFDIEKQDGNNRNLQIAMIDVGGKRLNLLNHHGYWIYGTKMGDDETLRQMHVIAGEIRKLEGPVIMCGDFNLSPDSESIKVINGELTNLSVKNGLKHTYTKLSPLKDAVSDYIFVNDQVQVKKFGTSDEPVSDHKALIMEFDV